MKHSHIQRKRDLHGFHYPGDKTLVMELPVIIQKNGLPAALKYALAKQKKDPVLVNHILAWFNQDLPFFDCEHLANPTDLIELILNMDNREYRFALRETLALLGAIKRKVSLLEDKKTIHLPLK